MTQAPGPAASGPALLARIESDETLFRYFEWCEFDVTRRDPAQPLTTASGERLEPVAGCNAGGTYFLCGPPGEPARPVVYADSEGRAGLVARCLPDLVELVVSIPFWHEFLYLGRAERELCAVAPGDLVRAMERDHLDELADTSFDPAWQEAAARSLGIGPRDRAALLARLCGTLALTRPGHVLHTLDGAPLGVLHEDRQVC